MAAGRSARNSRAAWAKIVVSRAPPGMRAQVRSTPSNRSRVARTPALCSKLLVQTPRRSAEPKPWVLWKLRLSPAISVYERPSRGS